jgi:sugar lactone lactonase YvrE
LFAFSSSAKAQYLTTVAGTGTGGYTGDGGLAINAKLNHPMDVAFDSKGNLYIADNSNFRIRKIDTSGIISTIAGIGIYGNTGDGDSATKAKIGPVSALAIDKLDNIYIAFESDIMRVRKIDRNGIISTYAGTGVAGYSGDGGLAINAKLDDGCYGLATDSIGNLYISDGLNNRIRKVDTSGIITTIAGTGQPGFSGDGGLAIQAKIWYPSGITIDKNGNILFSDGDNSKIRKIDKNGVISTVVNSTAHGITTDILGNIYFTDPTNDKVRIFDITGNFQILAGMYPGGYNVDSGVATSVRLSAPFGITIDKQGNIYFADAMNNRIRKVTSVTGVQTLLNSEEQSLKIIQHSNNELLFFQKENKGTVSILDIYGKEIITENHNENIFIININDFVSGIYVVRFASSNKQLTIKIVKI